MWSVVTDLVVWSTSQSVCLSVCCSREPCKNGWTDRDAVWIVGSDWPKESWVRWGSKSPWKGQFWGKGAPIVKYRDFLPWAVQKRLNWLNSSLDCGLRWAKGSTSSIVVARWRQCAQFQSYSPGGTNVPDDTLLWAVQKRLNRSTVVDSGGPKEAQVQLYWPGGANVPT